MAVLCSGLLLKFGGSQVAIQCKAFAQDKKVQHEECLGLCNIYIRCQYIRSIRAHSKTLRLLHHFNYNGTIVRWLILSCFSAYACRVFPCMALFFIFFGWRWWYCTALNSCASADTWSTTFHFTLNLPLPNFLSTTAAVPTFQADHFRIIWPCLSSGISILYKCQSSVYLFLRKQPKDNIFYAHSYEVLQPCRALQFVILAHRVHLNWLKYSDERWVLFPYPHEAVLWSTQNTYHTWSRSVIVSFVDLWPKSNFPVHNKLCRIFSQQWWRHKPSGPDQESKGWVSNRNSQCTLAQRETISQHLPHQKYWQVSSH